MLTYHRTSILTSQAQTVVNTVNTVGVMGKGLAAAFKARFPDMAKAYRKLCAAKQFQIGQLWLWKAPDQWVLNFPTKKHWRNPSKLSYVEVGLKKFVAQYEERGIHEIAFPRLGCGNGELDWQDVRPLMESYLKPLPITVYIHDYVADIGLPEHRETAGSSDFQRSFKILLRDMGDLLRAGGNFRTFHNLSPFWAEFDDAQNLLIERNGHRSIVPNDELYELWTLLLRGPVTRRKLPGAARDSAYYIFPILALLPYIRAIEVSHPDEVGAIAVELLGQSSNIQVIPPNGSDQGKFEWG